MFGTIVGNFVGGIMWGVGATLVGQVTSGAGAEGGEERLRDVTKGAVKAYLVAANRVQEVAEDIRGNFAEIVAEAVAESASTGAGTARAGGRAAGGGVGGGAGGGAGATATRRTASNG